jgi:hypothetical protein
MTAKKTRITVTNRTVRNGKSGELSASTEVVLSTWNPCRAADTDTPTEHRRASKSAGNTA